jgi:hypothetical protein
MFKYVWNKAIYNIIRVQLNTNFIFKQFCRSLQQDMDLSVYCVPPKNHHTFIDFMFEENEELSNLAKIYSNRVDHL